MWRHSSSKSTDSDTAALLGDELGATTNIHAEHPTTHLRRLRLVHWEGLAQLCGLRKTRSGTRSDYNAMATVGSVIAQMEWDRKAVDGEDLVTGKGKGIMQEYI
ncbi:hypothetical protein FSHL1_012281 [Fusarium sambucinum]